MPSTHHFRNSQQTVLLDNQVGKNSTCSLQETNVVSSHMITVNWKVTTFPDLVLLTMTIDNRVSIVR